MKSVPEIAENYNGVITSQPVHTMNPRELIESLMQIYNVIENGDPNNVGMTRTERFRDLARHTVDFIQATTMTMQMMQENMDELSKLFNHHVHTSGGHNTAAHSNMRSSYLDQMHTTMARVQSSNIKPEEGKMM